MRMFIIFSTKISKIFENAEFNITDSNSNVRDRRTKSTFNLDPEFQYRHGPKFCYKCAAHYSLLPSKLFVRNTIIDIYLSRNHGKV